MRTVVITPELIKNYPHKTSKNTPSRPYCRLCANFDRRRFHGQGRVWSNFNVKVLEIGEEAMEVKFRNGTLAYYHLACWKDRKYAHKVENIKKQSVESQYIPQESLSTI